jgi:hypothetical protein
MCKKYLIKIGELTLGYTHFEKADASMGVVFGKLNFAEQRFGYDFLKEYCTENQIELASYDPEDKLISTMTIPDLKITNENSIEIKGIGNQITGMDNDEFEISIFGIPSQLYEEEFPDHV